MLPKTPGSTPATPQIANGMSYPQIPLSADID